jgi:hypothetical protein
MAEKGEYVAAGAVMEMVISFDSASHAILAEQILSEAGIPVTVMPTPSAIRAGCGFSLRLSQNLLDAAIENLKNNGVLYSSVFSRDDRQGKSVYLPLKGGIVADGKTPGE